MSSTIHDEPERFSAVDPRTHPAIRIRPDHVVGRLAEHALVVTIGQGSDDPRAESVKVWSEGEDLDLVRLELSPADALALAELLIAAARPR